MIQRYGNKHGISRFNDTAIMSFEILDRASSTNLSEAVELLSESSNLFVYGDRMKLKDYTIATNGVRNNLPNEMKSLISQNHLIPGLMKKQVKFLYGSGPFLYQESFEDNHLKRQWSERRSHPEFWRWIDSWKANGLPDNFETYAKKVSTDYYYTEDYYSKRHMNLSRRSPHSGGIIVRGLEHISAIKARLGTEKSIPTASEIKDSDLNLVAVGNWLNPWDKEIEIYDRYSDADPFASEVSISYVRDCSYGDEIYSTPTYYFGLRDWITGSNLNPRYVNSFLKHSFNAKVHCIIPHAWFATKEAKFREYCDENVEREQRGVDLIKEYEGVSLVSSTGKPLEFNTSMVQKCVDLKIEQLTNVMSGEGKNQGKIFYSRSFQTEYGIEGWDFKEIPTNYKEFMTSINEYDKRAVRVIVEAMGLDPVLSNIGSEGIFSSTGAQVYYNYLVYLNSLQYAEEYICQDINSAIQINFPHLAKEGFKLGFHRSVPQRLEETNPKERPSQTTTT